MGQRMIIKNPAKLMWEAKYEQKEREEDHQKECDRKDVLLINLLISILLFHYQVK